MSLRPPISDLVCTSFVSQCLRNQRYAILVLFPLRHDFSVARCHRLGEPENDERNENKKERRNKKRETKKVIHTLIEHKHRTAQKQFAVVTRRKQRRANN